MQDDTGMTVWKTVSLNKQETRTHGWHAVVEHEVEPGTWKCRAYIEPLAGGEQIVAPTLFPDSDAAMQWCLTELGQRIPIIRLARFVERPTPSADLQQAVLQRLRQYDVLTVRRLVPQTLSRWDSARARVLHTMEDYREGRWLGLEGGWYFWYTIQALNYTALDPAVPPGAISFGDDWLQIEREGREWGAELANLPLSFYTAIYSFTLGVYDWLRTSDLRPYLQPGQREQDVIRQFIEEDWKIQVGLD